MRFSSWFKDASIRRKFIFIAFLATGVAVLFAILLLTLMQWFVLREEMVKSVSAQASIIATNSTEAIASNDHEKAENIVKALAHIDNIEFAGILDKHGNNFALYSSPGMMIPPHRHQTVENVKGSGIAHLFVMPPHQHQEVENEYHIHTAQYIEVVVPVIKEQEFIGMIHVRASMAPVYEQLKWNALISVAAGAGAFLVAVMTIIYLLPSITNPLHSLIGLMKNVSRDNDFTLRSELHSSDEIGTLATGFNTMLKHIQQRDDELARHREQLEEEVAKRTARLTEAQRIAHIGNWEWDIRDNTLTWSDEIYRIFGLTPQQFTPTYESFTQTVHPQDRQALDTSIRETLEMRKPYNIEHRILLADGTIRHVYERGEVFRDKEEKPIRMLGTVQDITVRKEAEEKVRKQQELTIKIIETVPMRIFWKDQDLRYLGCNTLFAKDAGLTHPNELIGKTDFDFAWKDRAELYRADDRNVMDSNTPKLSYDEPQTTPDGKMIWLRTSKVPLHNETNEIIGMLGVYEAITDYKQMELKIQESEERFRHIAELTTDWVWQVDEHGTYVYSGENVYNLLGYTPEEVCGKTPFDFMPPEEAARIKKIFKNIISAKQPFSFLENTNLHKDGHTIILETSGVPLIDDNGAFHGYFGTERDITERKRIEEEIKRLATTDSLTGIANRRAFNTQLEQEIERAKRYGTPLSVLMYDIDYFKRVNDTFGHDVGDTVLQALTALVKSNIRAVDIVARWGGEEFMVLMPQSDATAARDAAEKLRQKIIDYPFETVGTLSVSFGVTEFAPQDNSNVFLKRVDDALYQAKQNGRNRVEVLVY